MGNYYINICLIFLSSCTNCRIDKYQSISHQEIDTIKHIVRVDSRKWSCIDRKDTLLVNNSYVKYVDLDSVIGIEVCINGISEVLSYGFDCSIPNALVPILHSYSNNRICLKRGQGENFREFIICALKNGKLVNRTYEIALATDLPNNIVVYQNYDTLTQIVIENLETNSKKVLIIPEELITEVIINTKINKHSLLLEFSNGVNLKLGY